MAHRIVPIFWVATMAVVSVCLLPTAGQATIHNLSDLNSAVVIDDSTQSGMSTWTVDGTDQLFQQWFWFRTGDGAEQSIDTLPLLGAVASNTNFNPGNDTLVVRYGSLETWYVDVKYSLQGGSAGSGASDIGEQITIFNADDGALGISFFQYSDFDLDNTANNDTVMMVNANTVRQWDPAFVLSETVATPSPNAYELANTSFAIRDKLNDGVATNLNNTPAIGVGITGDASWAFQWNFTVPAGGSVQISKDKRIGSFIPEPLTLLGFTMGAGGLIRYLRRRNG